jgi:hypothetical protein
LLSSISVTVVHGEEGMLLVFIKGVHLLADRCFLVCRCPVH